LLTQKLKFRQILRSKLQTKFASIRLRKQHDWAVLAMPTLIEKLNYIFQELAKNKKF